MLCVDMQPRITLLQWRYAFSISLKPGVQIRINHMNCLYNDVKRHEANTAVQCNSKV